MTESQSVASLLLIATGSRHLFQRNKFNNLNGGSRLVLTQAIKKGRLKK
jgi:hypothetical protein